MSLYPEFHASDADELAAAIVSAALEIQQELDDRETSRTTAPTDPWGWDVPADDGGRWW